jgi:hemoglobin
MFDRWLAIWAETTSDLVPGAAAQALQERAGRIAESLQLGLAFRRDVRAA